jgi:hypothetical protein
MIFTVEFGLSAWSTGAWHVGLYETGFVRGFGGHGTRSSTAKQQLLLEVEHRQRGYLKNRYKEALPLRCDSSGVPPAFHLEPYELRAPLE